MLKVEKFKLANGLRVVIDYDQLSPMVAVNILYNIGAKHENPHKTGFAHLFEHLMFEGSKHIPSYDEPLQKAGGDNNAFTNNDYTNYYLTLPKENIETALWLESDRMMELAFSEKKLNIQKQVVIEEYKQRYLNQPYGDVWLLLRPLAYKVHPYLWPTIGKDISHIEQATLNDVKDFFFRYYAPDNAVLTISGGCKPEQAMLLVEKYFSQIPNRQVKHNLLPVEPVQLSPNFLEVKRNVPTDTIYKAYHIAGRLSDDYYATDLLSDVLGNGHSSQLYLALVQEKNIFTEIDAYITGEIDPGLFIITGKPVDGIDLETADKHIEQALNDFLKRGISEYELQKVKNKVVSSQIYSRITILGKAMKMAYYENLHSVEMIEQVIPAYKAVSVKDILTVAQQIFKPENTTTLYYKKLSSGKK
jgi:zinc protease